MRTKWSFTEKFCGTALREWKKAAVLFMASATLILFMSAVPPAESKEAEILLLHTNNVTGHLFPCPT